MRMTKCAERTHFLTMSRQKASNRPRSHGPPWECRLGRSASGFRIPRRPDDAERRGTAFPRRTVRTSRAGLFSSVSGRCFLRLQPWIMPSIDTAPQIREEGGVGRPSPSVNTPDRRDCESRNAPNEPICEHPDRQDCVSRIAPNEPICELPGLSAVRITKCAERTHF